MIPAEKCEEMVHTLDAMLPKAEYAYVLVVVPADNPTQSVTVSNMVQEGAMMLLEAALEGENGPSVQVGKH